MTTFKSRNEACGWGYTTNHGAAVYVAVFAGFIKIGSSKNWKDRTRALLFGPPFNGARFEAFHIGNETASHRGLERSIHLALTSFRTIPRCFEFSTPRECYRRSPDMERALIAWLLNNYSDEAFELVRSIGLAREAELESALPDVDGDEIQRRDSKIVSVQMDDELREQIRVSAKSKGISFSAWMREAIAEKTNSRRKSAC